MVYSSKCSILAGAIVNRCKFCGSGTNVIALQRAGRL